MSRAVEPISDASARRNRYLLPTLESFSSDIELGRNISERFEPSRKRRQSAILASMGAPVQRSGSVLLGLLQRGIFHMCPIPRARYGPVRQSPGAGFFARN